MDNLCRAQLDSPIGSITIIGDRRSVVRVCLPGTAPTDVVSFPVAPPDAISTLAATELHEYFTGTRTKFTVPVSFAAGTEFQRAVWTAIAAIPYGETRTYAWLSKEIGRPGSVRAVGGACGRNPVPIIVPCHRVIGSDGLLTGFTGGLDLKTALLALERRFACGRD